MRRTDKGVSEQKARQILSESQKGVLATIGENGYPYAVPVNYVYRDNAIYFHSAVSGYKIDNMMRNPKVCFCVDQKDHIIVEKFTTRFESAVVFGQAVELVDAQKIDALRLIVQKLAPDNIPAGEQYIRTAADKARVFRIDIEQMTGKSSHMGGK